MTLNDDEIAAVLTRRISQRVANIAATSPPRRFLIGIIGGPGSGKSTLAARLAETLAAAVIPMDGFHMRQEKLKSLGFAAQKGAPHTFEAEAFAGFLAHLKSATGPVSGPIYTRDIEEVTENGYTVPPQTPILIVEGNYLLLDTPPWNRIRPLLDLAVHLELPRDTVRARLLRRHAEHGLFSPEHVATHVEQVDLPNYDLVSATARHADLVIVSRQISSPLP
ncbi:nucleoside/nucleotide kinase family protein [Pelagibacterium sediminicola]|uniref:nucleoside/nucleotide kinase family protein n=1 Tax=Pelagibacterium sediminicola TaxID=2248761 RepID=UPI0013007290|nr:nucleoside/nucleotide kinase family protein [Pelagibacterium sediminicola]